MEEEGVVPPTSPLTVATTLLWATEDTEELHGSFVPESAEEPSEAMEPGGSKLLCPTDEEVHLWPQHPDPDTRTCTLEADEFPWMQTHPKSNEVEMTPE